VLEQIKPGSMGYQPVREFSFNWLLDLVVSKEVPFSRPCIEDSFQVVAIGRKPSKMVLFARRP